MLWTIEKGEKIKNKKNGSSKNAISLNSEATK